MLLGYGYWLGWFCYNRPLRRNRERRKDMAYYEFVRYDLLDALGLEEAA